MRAIAAQSLCLICKLDLATLGPEASRRAVRLPGYVAQIQVADSMP